MSGLPLDDGGGFGERDIMKALRRLIAENLAGAAIAMPSVCSAHPDVLAAAMLLARRRDVPILIEATSNQVNQFGGYTGMTPDDFVAFVHRVCDETALPRERVLLGGDHLGPQVWRDQPAETAMERARELMRAYVRAGFTKIHLDCSEGCAGEPAQVGDAVSAARAAELAAVCEAAGTDPESLSYMFGTEVPPPGGARADEEDIAITPTSPERALATIAAHRHAFAVHDLAGTAWPRAVGLVVQPGLEFAPDHVHRFDVAGADHLSPVLADHEGLAFEAHSTDYQAPAVFPDLARRHFAVLKVGPALTYAYRQAIYALDAVASWVTPETEREPLTVVMERLMLAQPKNWAKHYAGDAGELRLLRHFSYADRIRYYWTQPEAVAAVNAIRDALVRRPPPRTVLEQYIAGSVLDRADALRTVAPDWTKAVIYAQIQQALEPYFVCYQGGKAAAAG